MKGHMNADFRVWQLKNGNWFGQVNDHDGKTFQPLAFSQPTKEKAQIELLKAWFEITFTETEYDECRGYEDRSFAN